MIKRYELEGISSNNQGICLPIFVCQAQRVGVNELLEEHDVCEENLIKIEEGEGNQKHSICIDPNISSIVIDVPHEIKFEVDESNCLLRGFEYSKNNEPIKDSDIFNSNQTDFNNAEDLRNTYSMSVVDFKYLSYTKVISWTRVALGTGRHE